MSNREYRNRLDRATQIRCSVRWEGEEGTGGSLGHPALRPIHPTCIAPIHPGVYIQRKTNIFTGYFSKQQLQMGTLLNFLGTYHVGHDGRELTLMICCETSVDIIRVAKRGFGFELRKDRKREKRRK